MTFLDPTGIVSGASDAFGLGGIGQPDLPALTPGAPKAMTALGNKYTPGVVSQLGTRYDPGTVNSFMQWELGRAQSGTMPASPQHTLMMLEAAKTHNATTPAPDVNPFDFLGNAASDVGQIVQGIPKMPEQILHDVTHAGEIPGDIGKIAGGDFSQITQTPILRLIPGAYTAQNVLTGDWKNELAHPVMSALDVLPAAKELGVGEAVGGLHVPGTEDLTVSDALDRAKGALGRTMPGQFLKESFSPDVRDVSRIMAEQPELVQARALPQFAARFTSDLDQLRQQSTQVESRIQQQITPERAPIIHQAITDPASIGATDMQSALDTIGATDAERAAALSFKQMSDAYGQYGLDAGTLTQRFVNGTPELYTPGDAARIDKVRKQLADVSTRATLRDAILNPDTADLDALHQSVAERLYDETLSKKQLQAVAQGYVHALDAQGYNTGDLLAQVTNGNKGAIREAMANVDPASLQQREGGVLTRPARGTPALPSSTRWLEANKDATEAAVNKATVKVGGKETSVLPARWQPAFQRFQMDAAQGYVEQHFAADDPAVPALMDAIHAHIYSDIPEDVRKAMDQEAVARVSELRATGVDPQYVHRVSNDAARAMNNPTVTTIVPSASQYQARLNDFTPAVDSLSVSLHHQGLELARQDAARDALGQIRDTHTETLRDVTAKYRPLAERVSARTGVPTAQALEELIRKDYRPWNETEAGFMAGRAGKFNFSDINLKSPDDTLLVSKPIASSLEMMASPPRYSRMLDPVLRVFKTAVLPFSSRWWLHHIAGNFIAATLEDPRIAAELPEAMGVARDLSGLNRALEDGRTDYELNGSTQDFINRIPDKFLAQLNGLKYSVEPDTLYKLKAGGKLGELAQAAGVQRLAEVGKTAADWSYQFVNTADTMYRVASYLSGEKGGLAEGLSPEEAGLRGMALVNKVMPRWLEMTPMERSVFRVAFPFYGLMSHAIRYAMRYPVDHPWRTAVFANLGRAEVHDFGTGLPQMLAGAFFLGKPDASGGVTGINVPTPFQHLGDEMTITGLLGETNPLVKLALQQVGYDPAAQGPNLYPEIKFDPKTGKLAAVPTSTGGLLGQLATSIIPQANIPLALLGTNGDMRNLISSNPDSAVRMLLSSAGVPILWKRYNLNQLAFAGENTREKNQQDVLNQALKSGDYSRAMTYPALRPYLGQLQQLYAAGKLATFVKGAAQPPSILTNNANQVGSQATTQAEVTAG